jgi:hypothetical protein
MAQFTIEISARIGAAFGIRTGVYIPQSEAALIYEPDYSKSEILPGALLQNQPFDEIKVVTVPIGDEAAINYTFPFDPLVDINYVKKVTETEVFGGASVVEMAGAKEADIRFRGVLWNKDGYFPDAQLEELLAVFREDTYLDVVSSSLFLHHGINSLYIKSVMLPALEGYRDTQPFIITAREIVPVELELFE